MAKKDDNNEVEDTTVETTTEQGLSLIHIS